MNDIFLDPLQQLNHILEPIVQTAKPLDFLRSQEPIWAHTIVEGDNHHVEIRCFNQSSPVVSGIGQRIVSAALDPDEYRQRVKDGRIRRRIDIYKETIFRLTVRDRVNTCRDAQVTILVKVSMTIHHITGNGKY